MADPEVRIKVKTTQEGGGAPLGKLTEALQRIPFVGGIATNVLSAMKDPVVALEKAFHAAAEAVKEFAGAQEQVATLDAALSKAGQLTEEYREKLQTLAGELQRTTSIADDEWLGVLTKLVQFGSKPETIGMDVEAVKNLAGVVGSLGAATSLYQKALQGNYQAFARYGIVVEEAGTQTERLAKLQELLALRGGGQLEARAESLNGRFANLRNAISDTSEAIGQQITRSLRLGDALDFIAGGFEWWSEKIGDTIEKLNGIQNSTSGVAESTSDYARQLGLVAQLSEKVAKATEEEVRWIKAKQQAEDELSDAQMALDLAKVDDAESSGRLSKRGAIQARHRIRSAAATGKFERERQADLQTLEANEQGFSDLLKVRGQLGARREQLVSQIGAGSMAERRANASAGTIRDLKAMRDAVSSGGETLYDRLPAIAASLALPGVGGAIASNLTKGSREQRIAEIDRAISIAERVGPVSLNAKRQELGAIDTQIGTLDSTIAGRRVAVSSANTEIGRRMATREQVFDLNQQRDAITSARDAGAGTAAALQQSLSAVLGSSQASVNVAQQFLRIAQETERRLQQLEGQARAQVNR